jgi:hypothetical protein
VRGDEPVRAHELKAIHGQVLTEKVGSWNSTGRFEAKRARMLAMPMKSLEQALHSKLPHHWVETEAKVTDCTYARLRAYIDGGGAEDQLAHYAVGFSYKVDGKTYSGELSSPVEVQPHDTFTIRYNPDRPEQNNSVESELDRPWFKDYMYVVGALILGLVIYGLLQQHVFHR